MGIKLAGKKDEPTEKDAAKAKAKPQRKPGELSRFQKIVIVLFVVVFALSTLAGALASVFQSTQQSDQTIELNTETIDAQYEGEVADLEAKVAENPEDAESLRTLGDDYMQWGTYVSVLASTDEETLHANDLFDKAIETYDKLLALGDDSDVRVNRAMCEYYQGDSTAAIDDLEQLAADDPDYASAWLNMGVIYQAKGDDENAVAAYEKAIELDPNDEQGAKSHAESRLEDLQGTDEDDEAGDDASDDGTADESGDATDGATTDGESDDSTN